MKFFIIFRKPFTHNKYSNTTTTNNNTNNISTADLASYPCIMRLQSINTACPWSLSDTPVAVLVRPQLDMHVVALSRQTEDSCRVLAWDMLRELQSRLWHDDFRWNVMNVLSLILWHVLVCMICWYVRFAIRGDVMCCVLVLLLEFLSMQVLLCLFEFYIIIRNKEWAHFISNHSKFNWCVLLPFQSRFKWRYGKATEPNVSYKSALQFS